ncbi:MAG: methyltransferase domain-containing protein [bacterium]
MNETSKTLQLLTDRELQYLSGKGIDIGCGPDPVRPDVKRFDVEDGDANRITAFVDDLASFDYVFSSHCLEHMSDADGAIQEWWKLVKPGGVLIVIVPDEDLYEQGYWPSLFNPDHKFTFSLSKQGSWSPVSRNCVALARGLPGAEPISIRLQDNAYKRSYLAPGVWPRLLARIAVRVRNATVRRVPVLRGALRGLFLVLRLPVDQTEGGATAQNIIIVAKQQK